MSELSAFRQAFEEAISNPKVATGVAAAMGSLGGAAVLDLVQGFFAFVSLLLGCIIGILVIRVHLVKYKLLKRAWDNGGMDKGMGDES